MKLKALIVASASAVALTAASSAFAADLAHKRQNTQRVAVLSAPAFSWAGGYAGLAGGYNFTSVKYKKAKNDNISEDDLKKKDAFFKKPDGALAGAYAGFNFDLGSDVVAGVETDFSGAFGKGKVEEVKDAGGNVTTRGTEINQKWNGATRVRLGYALDNVLPFVAGGVAYAGVQTHIDGVQDADKYVDHSLVGFTVGAGVDYAVTQNIAVRAEYRYNSYGAFKVAIDTNNPATENEFNFGANDVRVGIAYKF